MTATTSTTPTTVTSGCFPGFCSGCLRVFLLVLVDVRVVQRRDVLSRELHWPHLATFSHH